LKPNTILNALALIAVCGLISACSSSARYSTTAAVEPAKKNGPPPHAPAHGYRHKHENNTLVFDSRLDLYIVKGYSNYYFHHNRYYRDTRSGWEFTAHIEGPWKPIATKNLPKGLRKTQQAKAGKKHKNK
jgi:hypothetical protein